MMVLGLVVQRQDTVSGVARRLTDQFTSARFPKSSAYHNLPRLAKKGYVQLIEAGRSKDSADDRYAVTPLGIEFFYRWLCSTELPPIVRDAIQCKLEFLKPEHVPAVIHLVREEEKVYTVAYDIARARVMKEQRSRRTLRRPADWRSRLRGIQNKYDASLWGLMSQRLERLGDELEELLREIPLDGAA